MTAPLLDAFGTRHRPDDVRDGLRDAGLDAFELRALDDALHLAVAPDALDGDAVARAVTWLRSRFSPLVPVHTEAHANAPREGLVRDLRARRPVSVFLAEIPSPDALDGAMRALQARAGFGLAAAPHAPPALEDPVLRDVMARMAPFALTVTALVRVRAALEPVGPLTLTAPPAGHHALVWTRPGADRGVRPAVLVAVSTDVPALRWLAQCLDGAAPPPPEAREVLLDGLAWQIARRPTLAVWDDPAHPSPVRVDDDRCDGCGVCRDVCPVGFLDARGRPTTPDADACLRCGECIEACPVDALRPVEDARTATRAAALAHRPGWLSRLAGAPGPSVPAPFPPSYFRPRPKGSPARVVLGLAVMTQQEHAAALVRDGRLVGAIELERITRERHAGWTAPDRPGVTAAVDPTIALEEVLCRPAIRALLQREGLTLDDVDRFAVNGLHGRYVSQIPFLEGDSEPPTLTAGRVVYVPHHRCHAASAARLSGLDRAWVLTIDGRGDRECAAVFRYEDGRLTLRRTLLALTDRSIGGVYEGVTRLLGFGSHGQGTVMALASFAAPTVDVSRFLSPTAVHEQGIDRAFAHLRRSPGDPLHDGHRALAASVQHALEETAASLLRDVAGDGPLDALCLAGGVSLNCRMNESLRRTFAPAAIFAQPGANDAGTALGAALEALALEGVSVAPLDHTGLGPDFDDASIERALRRAGIDYTRVDDVADETAARLARGEVVAWFQGPMEFGPRALGARSLLADARAPSMHARVNALKQREPWRPFGPSILAGHERDWFEDAFDTRFMLFTQTVRPERRAAVPAIVHVDGTTRPQVVHAEHLPRYHAMLSAFFARTGVPLVLDTSFNRRGEPIVCTPDDAVACFTALGADALAIGNFIATRAPAPRVLDSDTTLRALPGGRRLALRLTTRCDFDCGHCTLRDHRDHGDRAPDDALRALADGRRAGCDALVILRGEATLRPDLPALIRRARAMGYTFVQLQTHGASLADVRVRTDVLGAGVDAVEAMLLAADPAQHDLLSGAPGSFRAVLTALQALAAWARGGRALLVTVPVVRGNLRSLGAIVALAQKLGLPRLQFNFPRPTETRGRAHTASLPRLEHAARAVASAAALCAQRGIAVSTEGFPLCHLPPELHGSPDATFDFDRVRVDDLHLLHDAQGTARRDDRPEAPACRTCSLRDRCPRTWGLYLELFGSDELRPR